MTDNELRVRLATALGWRPLEVAGQWHITREYGGKSEFMPEWPLSVDACIRDLIPACREKGMTEWTLIEDHPNCFQATILTPASAFFGDSCETPARAFAEACLSCLEAGE